MDERNEKGATVPPELTDELRDFIRWGLHKLICTPREAILVGPPDKIGRLKGHHDLLPAFGDKTGDWPCMCSEMDIIYNGELV